MSGKEFDGRYVTRYEYENKTDISTYLISINITYQFGNY